MNKKIFAYCSALATILFAVQSSVQAYSYLGTGKWSNGNVKYAISSDVPTSYVNPIQWGAEMWSNNSDFKPTRNNNCQITVYAYNYGDTAWDGITFINGHDDVPINENYSYANIQLNRYFMDNYDDLRKKLVACHEFGHTASLAHSSAYTIMYNNVWVAYNLSSENLRYSPAADDIAGVNARY